MHIERDLEKTAARYHDTILHGWESLYATMRKALFDRFCPFFTGRRVLEVGCGDGEMTQYLSRHFPDITVLDGSEAMLNECRHRLGNADIRYILAMFEEYEPGSGYDTIIMSHVLEHLDEPVEMLKKISGWLNNNGRLLVAVPNAWSIHRQAGVKMGLLEHSASLNEQDLLLGHRRVYDPETLRSHCEAAGLNVVHFGGVMFKPLANRDIEKYWTREMIEAFIKLGDDFPELSAEIFVVLERKKN